MKTCSILGVPVLVTNMDEVVNVIEKDIDRLRGKYVCVTNVHTVVTAHDNPDYMKVQRGAAFIVPDGKPLSMEEKKRGYKDAGRVAGPDLMEVMFGRNNGLKHYFYGGSPETIEALKTKLPEKYPSMKMAGFVSPPYRKLTDSEDEEAVKLINESGADILWVGLGAPKQENWMAAHEGKVNAVMLGVGAGFDFHAGTVKRAPKWMQKLCLEWLYRLFQDPKRLFKRYLGTNMRYMKLVRKERKEVL